MSLIGIDKKGNWLPLNAPALLENPLVTNKSISANQMTKTVIQSLEAPKDNNHKSFDVLFPVLHGPYGEDGSVQGLCKLLDIPCVGADILGSAVGMDKDITKRLLRDAGIPTAKFLVINRTTPPIFAEIKKQLGLPFFVKPANLGSSIGVTKVTKVEEFKKAITTALSYDTKILIEEEIAGREIECSVLGNDKPIASVPGEIIVGKGFYDYETKYIDEDNATLQIPADLPKSLIQKVQKIAIQTFEVLCLTGMARVDFFLSKTGGLFVNEVNTLPGFTNISMYPKLWEASGVSQQALLDKLISLALEKHRLQNNLRTTYK